MQTIMTHDAAILAVIDVNINRAKEALRVCEEIFRFVVKDKALCEALRAARHRVTVLSLNSGVHYQGLAKARDSKKDIGRSSRRSRNRNTVIKVLFSNFARAKESLRVLEEFFYLVNRKTSSGFKKLRYRVYGLERIALTRI